MSAEEVIEMIDRMETEEKWKLLNELFHKYYNKYGMEYSEVDFDC